MTEDELAGMALLIQWAGVSATVGDGEGPEAWGAADHGIANCRTRLSDRITTRVDPTLCGRAKLTFFCFCDNSTSQGSIP